VTLPQADLAIIDRQKLTDYALSPEHPVGRFKAVFFAKIGFTIRNWKQLDLELRRLVRQTPAELDDMTRFGQKYVVRGKIVGSRGRTAEILTVWIILKGEQIPRLVTLYPGT
jgi:hypothetical protein